jgi:isopenicillin-N epimerase
MISGLKSQFLLDPSVIFLNHGSFGACPQPVFEAYQRWQLEMERQPVAFLHRRYDALMNEARAKLAAFVGTDADNLIFLPNATVGINLVVRSLPLKPGDEILATNHEYGAVDYTWEFICQKTGAHYVRHPISLPVTSPDAFVEALWSAVTPRTKVIAISHITSPTALIFPVEEICRRARDMGILTVIDGAHTPGHIDLNLESIGADFYTGNCHKWLSAPKGSGFLYARPEHHKTLEPLVISWGYGDDSTFASRNQWQGTRDIAAYLSVAAAIDFQEANQWDKVRQHCHALASETRAKLAELTGLPPISPDSVDWFGQMVTIPLPLLDTLDLKRRLYDEFCVEVPVITWENQPFIRVSFQGYNTAEDADALIAAMKILLSL